MAHRLPIPGSDNGTWGDILNDFLLQAHDTDGSLLNGLITDAKISSSAAIAKAKLAAGVQTSLTAADNAAPLNTTMYSTFVGKTDGIPTTTDSGQTLTLVKSSAANAGLRVVSGTLTSTENGANVSAGYAQTQLPGVVQRIGAKFSFSAGTVTGAVNIAIWKSSITSWPTIPDSPLHLTITPSTWGITTWNGNSPTNLVTSTTLSTALAQDGTVYTVEAFIDGSDVYVRLPDGTSVGPFASAAVSTNAGVYTNHEVYQNDASTECKGSFVDIWADVAV
jgi:hypothetical protein